MQVISDEIIEVLSKLIDRTFNVAAFNLLGIAPKQNKGKSIYFSTKKDSLSDLFIKSLGRKKMTKEERSLLKMNLNIANSYMEVLKMKTKTRVITAIDSHVKETYRKQEKINSKEILEIFQKEMDKSKSNLETIIVSESNKSINYGTAMKIARMTKTKGVDDPTVFFMVTIDDVTGSEEFVLHLLPDRITPRVWKLSEISHEYHKKGDSNPSMAGLHPRCRCKIAYLADGWGFDDKGKIKFRGLDHNELSNQREKYGLPR